VKDAKKRGRARTIGAHKAKSAVDEVELASVGRAIVVTRDAPSKPPADKQIHARRRLPVVPEKPSD